MDEYYESGELVKRVSYPLYRAKGWITLISVLSILGGALAVLFGIVLLVTGLIASSSYGRFGSPYANTFSFVYFMIYAGGGGIYIWLGILLSGVSSKIKVARETGDFDAIVSAQEKLKTYFVILGIIFLVGLIISIIAIIFYGWFILSMLSRGYY